MDLDQRLRRAAWIYGVVGLLGYFALLYVLSRVMGPLIALLYTAPIVAGVLSYWLVTYGIGGTWRWMKARAYRGMEGRYHAFDGRPVRVQWGPGECEVVVEDVLAIFGEKLDARQLQRLVLRYPEGGVFQDEHGVWWFAEAAVLDWVGARAGRFDQLARRMYHWLRRDVFYPMQQKHARSPLARPLLDDGEVTGAPTRVGNRGTHGEAGGR